MTFKLPFILLAVGVTALTLIAFSPAIYAAIEPHITIVMDSGQTTDPFQIKDESNQNVFQVKVNGGFDPIPVVTTEVTMNNALYAEWFPIWDKSANIGTIMPASESGPGVYQYEYTVTANDLAVVADSAGLFSMDDFVPFPSLAGQNLDGASINIAVKMFVNDVERHSTTQTASGNNFITYFYADLAEYAHEDNTYPYLSAGDTIGIKLWQTGGVANSFQLNHAMMSGIPTLTTVAHSMTLGDMNFIKFPNLVHVDVPSEFTGTSGSFFRECLEAYHYNWGECFGDNFFGLSHSNYGQKWVYNLGSAGLSSPSTNVIVMAGEGDLKDGGTLIVNTWR